MLTLTGDGHERISISVEGLNNYNPPGLPLHSLRIKRGHIIMLLRNLNVMEGLCNGTRLSVTDMSDSVLKCKVLVGPSKDRMMLIFNPSLLVLIYSQQSQNVQSFDPSGST